MTELITIVTPVYNSGSLIKELYDCINQQTYEKFEWLIINDGSDDQNTLAILNEFDEVPFIRRLDQHNNGAPSARNKGLEHAEGEYVKFVDADDLMPENHLESQIKSFRKSKKLKGIVVSPVKIISDYNNSKVVKHKRKLCEDFFAYPLYHSLKMFEFHHSGCLYQTSYLRRNNMRWDESLKAYQDLDFLWQLMLKGATFIIDNDTFFINREHDYTERITTQKSPEKWMSRFRAVEKVFHEIKEQKKEELFFDNINRRFNKIIVGALFEIPSLGLKLYKKRKKLTGIGINGNLLNRLLKKPLKAVLKR